MSRRDVVKTSTLAAGALAASGFLGKPQEALAAGPAWEQVGGGGPVRPLRVPAAASGVSAGLSVRSLRGEGRICGSRHYSPPPCQLGTAP